MAERARRVLFVCVENSCRSQMAEGFARALGAGRVEAWSAGSRPSGEVDPRAVQLMRERGIDLAAHRSKGLGELPAGEAWDAVVTMGCGDACPAVPARLRLDWDLPDPKRLPDEGFRRVRDEIEERVRRLLADPALGAARSAGAADQRDAPRRLTLFERYLSLWVVLCMAGGIALGQAAPGAMEALRALELGEGSQVNAPIAVLIWLMIVPMMMKVDFTAIRNVGRRPEGLVVTLAVNWLIKPFSMALLAWLFFRHVFAAWIAAPEADQYIAGAIILAAAPCTAMVFVWSHLTRGDPAYTLVQVSVNDLLMLFLFAPIVRFLVRGASSLEVPFRVLLVSVGAFIVIPLVAGWAIRSWALRRRGAAWFEGRLLPRLAPVSMGALLATLVLIFAFQTENIVGRPGHVLLIAIPILLQVYLNSGLAYGLMRLVRAPHAVAAPGALIGASNFFELAVATAIALFGPGSGAALATVVGVLVEVPVMLSVCAFLNRTRGWYTAACRAA